MSGYRKCLVFALLLLSSILFSQDELQPGLPFLTYYPFEEYGASPQNWDVVQAQNGIMYFANGDGILEFDGARWRLIKMPNKTIVRSLDVADDGTIYVGGYEDFGYLEPGNNGLLKFTSLKHKLPDSTHYFQDVWTTVTLKNKVFFQTTHSIFVFDNDTVKELKAGGYFIWGNKSQGFYFTHDMPNALKIYQDGELKELKGTDEFNNNEIYNVLNYRNNQLLLVTGWGNMFIALLDTIKPAIQIIDSVHNNTSAFMKENYFYSGINYNDNRLCFATYYGGILITDMQFNPLLNISKDFGLNNNNIRMIYKDQNDNLWLAKDRGITFVEMDLSQSIFNQYSNLSGSINSAIIFDNPHDAIPKRLYVASIEQIFYKEINGDLNPLDPEKFQKFQPYSDYRLETWKFFEYRNTLLCATSFGVYEIKNNTLHKLSPHASWSFTTVKDRPDLILVNLNKGLDLLQIKNGKWTYKGKVNGFDEYTSTSVFDKHGFLWVECVSDGLYKLKLSDHYDSVLLKENYSVDKGLPTKTLNYPSTLNNALSISTEKGIYTYKPGQDFFVPDSGLNALVGEIQLDFLKQVPNKNIWYSSSSTKSLGELIYQPDGTYTRDTSVYNEIKNLTIWDIYYYNDSAVFFCSPNGLIFYDKTKRKKNIKYFNTLIRKVEILNNPDHIEIINPFPDGKKEIHLNYNQNAIRISYAVPYYVNPTNNQYSYYLEGFDKKDNWSAWTNQTEKEYNFLKEGKYTFHVKSRGVFMEKGSIASFDLKISPPFFRTKIAYLLYAIAFSLLVYMIIVFNSRRLKMANIRLEEKIAERTREISKQNDQLREQRRYILEQRNDLQSLNANKDKFFGIIAHDLKTPFNTIIGFSELLMENIQNNENEQNQAYAEIINKSATSTFELLQNLLSWSNIQRNNINYNPQPISVKDIVDKSIESLLPVIQHKNIKTIAPINPSIEAFADENMVLTIVRNLLSNAVKFSFQNSTIEIHAKQSNQEIVVSIADKGIGMKQEKMDKLFNVEENISTAGTENEKGSGLGLILCKEFIKINRGEIWVQSTEGKGTTFFFTLPIE